MNATRKALLALTIAAGIATPATALALDGADTAPSAPQVEATYQAGHEMTEYTDREAELANKELVLEDLVPEDPVADERDLVSKWNAALDNDFEDWDFEEDGCPGCGMG